METPTARSWVSSLFSFSLERRSIASGLRTTLSVMLVTASRTRGASITFPALTVSSTSFSAISVLPRAARAAGSSTSTLTFSS